MDLNDVPAPPRHKTAREFVYDEVTAAMGNGRLRPGQHLSEQDLSEWLKVSRTPIREALSALATDGLIELIPHHGAVVKRMDPADLREEYVVRAALESLAVELGVPKVPEEVLDELTELNEQMHVHLDAEDIAAFLGMNRELHLRLYGYSESARLVAMIEASWQREDFFRRYYYSAADARDSEHHMHEELLDAYRRRDAGRARDLVARSLLTTGEQISRRLAESDVDHPSSGRLSSLAPGKETQ